MLIAERRLGLDPRRELEAAELGAKLQDPAKTCEFSQWLLRAVDSEAACIIGPLAEGVPQCPGLIMSVEQAAWLAPRLDIVTGDLDALLSPPVPLSTARFWLVHLHGDNLPLSRLLADRIHGSIVYTSQRYCLWPLIGIG
ncbi:MAG: hypothetical protein F7C33_06520, partial [Desulfurococcales archaeon]|nr:hypothetical protein [Desulfurococcales archaeon]